MEFQLFNKPMIFIGGQFVWDPTGLLFQNNHFIFSCQKLFIDEEMLKRLYVIYEDKRKTRKTSFKSKNLTIFSLLWIWT
jgi:hypothetical protein